MKNKIGLSVAVIMILLAGWISAQTKPVITIGGSLWNAKLEFEGDAYGSMKAESGNWIGPYLNIRFGKLLLGTSMYFGKIPIKIASEESDISFDLNRSDLNFSLGYSLTKNLTAFFAVKNASIKGDMTYPPYSFVYYDYYGDPYYNTDDINMEMENKGTLLGGGLSGTYRFPQSPIFIFGSFALLTGPLNSTVSYSYLGESFGEPIEQKNDVNMTSYNGGIGFQTNSGFSILLGYRGETSSSKGDATEKINGLMVTLAYTLR